MGATSARVQQALVASRAVVGASRFRRITWPVAALAWVIALGPWLWWLVIRPDGVLGLIGFDLGIYVDASAAWLRGDGYYLERQLAGPYAIQNGDVLYPPVSLWLFVPFTIVPRPFFWVSLVIVGWMVLRHRPSAVGWLLIGICLIPPLSMQQFLKGNPVMWVVAAEALAFRWAWAAAFVLLKPTVAPFVAVGLRDPRRLGAGLLAFGALCLPVLPMHAQWLAAVMNANGGLLYGIRDVPLMLIPLIAYATRRRVAEAPQTAVVTQ